MVTIILACLCGAFSGAAAPLFYELLAEVTFPVPEGASGSVLSLCENVGAFLMYQSVALLAPTSLMNAIYALGMATSVAIMALVRAQYRRRAWRAVEAAA